jgi:hypothetical protein
MISPGAYDLLTAMVGTYVTAREMHGYIKQETTPERSAEHLFSALLDLINHRAIVWRYEQDWGRSGATDWSSNSAEFIRTWIKCHGHTGPSDANYGDHVMEFEVTEAGRKAALERIPDEGFAGLVLQWYGWDPLKLNRPA